MRETNIVPDEVQQVAPAAFDRKDGARYIGVSTRKFDDLLSAGEIRRLKSGRKTLALRSDCDDYLARLAEEAVS